MKQKTPDSYNEKSFKLPPPKERRRIPKDEVNLPSHHGSSDQNKKTSFESNISPPINESVLYKAKSPTNKGLIPKSIHKKSAPDKKTPIHKKIMKIRTIPSSTGVVHSKKALSNAINQPPPSRIQEKTPKKDTSKYSTIGAKKDKKNSVNQPPPPKFHNKIPGKKTILPPPIFEDKKTKIPKTRLKSKKPK
ncbi:MAG: hypothetical protein ACXADY_10765 [Candidatus Hodarchaeales archaeon]